MKTFEDFYKEINESEELRKAASEIRDKTALADFLKEHDCEASMDEVEKYVKSQIEGEIGDDAAAAAAGGIAETEVNGAIGDFFYHIFHPGVDGPEVYYPYHYKT